MAAQTQAPPRAKSSGTKGSGTRRGFTLLIGLVCFSLLAYLLFQIVHQFVTPAVSHRLVQLQDIPLPTGFPLSGGKPSLAEEKLLAAGTDPNALTPGVALSDFADG